MKENTEGNTDREEKTKTAQNHHWVNLSKLVAAFRTTVFIIIIGIEPLRLFGQRPDLSQATGMVLVRCNLGKFLGVVFHCFPPAFRRSHFRHQVPPRPPRRERS